MMQSPVERMPVVFVGFAFVALFFSVMSSDGLARERSIQQRWALLIGIGEYESLPHLQGPSNDVEILSYVLRKRYGFHEEKMTVLHNNAATRARILLAFEKLITKAKPSDMVYIHYSGHGSQVKDLNGDEFDDHKDETFVPYDGRTRQIPDITDDEFNTLLNRIHAQRVIVSIDACHSGSATRGVSIRSRTIPPDTRLELYENSQRFTRGARTLSSPNAIVFSSSAPHERALDGRIAGRYHGYFSYAVFQILFSVSQEANPQMIFEDVKRELNDIKNLLHRRTFPAPQLEVSKKLSNEPLFPHYDNGKEYDADSSHNPVGRPKVLVEPMGDGRVQLEPARYLGGMPTSVWEILPLNVPHSVRAKNRVLAKVTTVKGMNAVAEVLGDEKLNLKNAHARLLEPAEPPTRLSILLRDFDDTLAHQGQKIREFFGLFSGHEKASKTESYVVDVHERDVEIRSADGLEEIKKFSSFDVNRLDDQLTDFLVQSLPAAKLRPLQNPDSSIHIQARLLNTIQDDQKRPALLSDPILHIRQPDEPSTKENSLQVEVWVNKPSFVTILDVDSEGAIRVLFPSPFQKSSFYPNGLIPANVNVTLPDSFDSTNRAGFIWDIGKPKGQDTLYILASSDALIADHVRHHAQEIQYDNNRAFRGESTELDTSYEKLRSFLYSDTYALNDKKEFNFVDSQSARKGLLRGAGNTVGPDTRESKILGDWNAVSLSFWIEDPD